MANLTVESLSRAALELAKAQETNPEPTWAGEFSPRTEWARGAAEKGFSAIDLSAVLSLGAQAQFMELLRRLRLTAAIRTRPRSELAERVGEIVGNPALLFWKLLSLPYCSQLPVTAPQLLEVYHYWSFPRFETLFDDGSTSTTATDQPALQGISATDLMRNLDRIKEAKRRTAIGEKTLAQFCAELDLPPVWSSDPLEQAAITARLVQLARPELDAGSIDIGALDLGPHRLIKNMQYQFGMLVDALRQRQAELAKRIGLEVTQELNSEAVAAIAERVSSQGISQDDFRSAAELVYLLQVSFGRIINANTLAREFHPDAKRGNAWFRVTEIADDYLEVAFEQCRSEVLQKIGSGEEKTGLALAKLLIEMGKLNQACLEKKIAEKILDYARWYDDEGIPEALKPYRHLVSAETYAGIKQEKVNRMLRSLREASPSIGSPQPYVKLLQAENTPQADIDAAVKDGYLVLLSRDGASSRASEYLALLPAGKVSQEEVTEALYAYTDQLTANANYGNDWLKIAAANRVHFRAGQFERAIMTAGYFARYGYFVTVDTFNRIREQYPGFAWDTLPTLAPPCYCTIDLRAAIMQELCDPTEQTLARLLCDFLGANTSANSIGTFCNFLRQAIAVSVGLPKETLSDFVATFVKFTDQMAISGGLASEDSQARRRAEKQTQEETRAALVLEAFGENKLTAVPYEALVKLRRKVADLVRTHAKAEIER